MEKIAEELKKIAALLDEDVTAEESYDPETQAYKVRRKRRKKMKAPERAKARKYRKRNKAQIKKQQKKYKKKFRRQLTKRRKIGSEMPEELRLAKALIASAKQLLTD